MGERIGRDDSGMEFHEKLQELRKQRGLTQEELAEALYVSRTAISKWESGRGYPSIDSLKEISNFFAVSIDDLLSGETLLSIAEKENKSNIRGLCDLLFGVLDICALLLIVLPIYPKTVDGYIHSVNLLEYTQNISYIRMIYLGVFLILITIGIAKIVLTRLNIIKGQKLLTDSSIGLSVCMVLFLAMTRQTYATMMIFLLLVIKGILFLKYRTSS